MAAKKEISGYIKLQIKGGQANPAPPVGPALGQRGVNIMEFFKISLYLFELLFIFILLPQYPLILLNHKLFLLLL